MHKACSCELSTGLSTGYPQGEEGLPLDDLLDVPPFFGDDTPATPFEGGSDTDMMERFGGTGAPSPIQLAAPGQVATKPGVRLPQSPLMAPALQIAAARGDVVTSGAEGYSGDGVHAATSQHYKGTAIDVRWAPDREAQQRRYANAGYVTLAEPTHLHVQKYRVA